MTTAGFTSLRSPRARTLLPTHRYTAVHDVGVENKFRGQTSRMLSCVHTCVVVLPRVVAVLLLVFDWEHFFTCLHLEHKL